MNNLRLPGIILGVLLLGAIVTCLPSAPMDENDVNENVAAMLALPATDAAQSYVDTSAQYPTDLATLAESHSVTEYDDAVAAAEAARLEAERIAAEQAAMEEQQIAQSASSQASYATAADYANYSGSSHWFKSAGVVQGDNYTYKWYSENQLPGDGLHDLNNNGRHVDGDGFIRDGDGYLAVAIGGVAKGTHVDTPFGEAIVYDSCETPGVCDMYVSW